MNSTIGHFHLASGHNTEGAGWWFQPEGTDDYIQVDFQTDKRPPLEILLNVVLDGTTVISWET
jgi:hypothetical protein